MNCAKSWDGKNKRQEKKGGTILAGMVRAGPREQVPCIRENGVLAGGTVQEKALRWTSRESLESSGETCEVGEERRSSQAGLPGPCEDSGSHSGAWGNQGRRLFSNLFQIDVQVGDGGGLAGAIAARAVGSGWIQDRF